MKKLSLLLSLLLILTALPLAACESDDSADNSSVDDSPVSLPSQESSESWTDGGITGLNIAPYAEYTLSPLYRQNDTGNWDDNADITYPDEDGITLTDGIFAASPDCGDSAWIGFHSETPRYKETEYHYINIDLKSGADITGAKLYVGTSQSGEGVSLPRSIELLTSDDGENWTTVTTAMPEDDSQNVVNGNKLIELPAGIVTRYLQIRIVNEGWTFISELEIYAGN